MLQASGTTAEGVTTTEAIERELATADVFFEDWTSVASGLDQLGSN